MIFLIIVRRVCLCIATGWVTLDSWPYWLCIDLCRIIKGNSIQVLLDLVDTNQSWKQRLISISSSLWRQALAPGSVRLDYQVPFCVDHVAITTLLRQPDGWSLDLAFMFVSGSFLFVRLWLHNTTHYIWQESRSFLSHCFCTVGVARVVKW